MRDLQAQLKQRHEQLQQEVAALQQERDLAAHIDVSDLEEEVASIDQVIRETQQRQELVKAELKRVGRPSAGRQAGRQHGAPTRQGPPPPPAAD